MVIKVLIINDQSDQNEVYDVLQSKGFAVNTINTKYDHIKAIRTVNPNVIIIDSQKAGNKNGFLLPGIRAICQVPIMILSVIDEPGIVEKFLDQGADEYLVKPVSSNLLIARIKALARRSNNLEGENSSSADISTSPIIS